jgi:hypothetical protein
MAALLRRMVMSVRTPVNCPFSPGSDTVPDIWAGRIDELSDWTDRLLPRRLAGMGERGRTVLGEAGIGKSALTARIAADARDAGHVVVPVVRIPKGVSGLVLLAEAIAQAADDVGLGTEQRADRWLRRLREVRAAGVSVAMDAPDRAPLHRAVFHTLVRLAEVAGADGRAVLVRVDEVQNSDATTLSQLLVAIGDALAATTPTTDAAGVAHDMALPLAVYLTALPEFHDLATAEAGATFGRRFAPLHLGPVADDDLRHALAPFVRDGWPVPTSHGPARVTAEPAALTRLVDLVRGDPFLFQLAGQRTWESGPGQVITVDDVPRGWAAATAEARRHVSRMLDRVPDRERAVLEAMAQLPSDRRNAGSIAERMGLDSSTQIGAASRRLEDLRGLIVRTRSGYRFTSRTIEAYLDGDWP